MMCSVAITVLVHQGGFSVDQYCGGLTLFLMTMQPIALQNLERKIQKFRNIIKII
jgi:hypothetical protein